MKQERSPQIPENVIYYSEKEGSKNAALIFQGQGVQEAGLGRDLYSENPTIKKLYDDASFYLRDLLGGRSLLDLTEEELKRTDFAQPAIFVYNEACRIAFEKEREERGEELVKPKFYAGNSLGFFNALYAAGAFASFEDALGLVAKRGELMQKVCEKMPGGMVSVPSSISKEDLIFLKNYYGLSKAIDYDTLVILAGTLENLAQGVYWLEEESGKNIHAKRLNVAGAFHSLLMKPAEEPLRDYVGEMRKTNKIKKIETPVISNTSAKPIGTSKEIEKEIVENLTKPVLWKQTIDFLNQEGVAATVEFGKKPVLSYLMKNRGKIAAAAGVVVGAAGVATFFLFRRNRPAGK